MSPTSFRRLVWAHYKKEGRHDLPWRKTRDPYKILVSEMMLQQTQVKRAIPFYENFIKKFPNPRALARAPLGDVLKAWQGLGYNRRAKMLREAAKHFPTTHRIEAFEALPGVGPYTARALAAFAYNQDVIFVETNIRTVVISLIYQTKRKVSDREIEAFLAKALPRGSAREWYGALMDYGAFLKRTGVKLNAKSAHYTKQSKFAGSNREARGAILRELTRGSRSEPRLLGLLGEDRASQLKSALTSLLSEHLIQKRGKVFTLPR